MADHPFFAAVYEVVSKMADSAGLADRRRRLLAAATGRVLEVGGGNGLNLTHYREVDNVIVLEPDGAMRRRLLERVATASVPVEVHEAAIDEAVFPERSFDTVVCSLVLCTVPDQASALRSIHKLLKPNGKLLFLEHVRATGWLAAFQRLATPLWRRVSAGCNLDRVTTRAIRDAGFVITDCERFRFSRADVFTGTMVQGVAIPRAEETAA